MSKTELYGLDAELAQNAAAKYSVEYEKEVSQWLTEVTGHPISNFHADIKNGVILCKVLNSVDYFFFLFFAIFM